MQARKCKIVHDAVDIDNNHLPYYLRDEYFTIIQENDTHTTVKHGLRKRVFENKYIEKV
ncbi:hypothetical protein H6A09_06495 [[Clostridium] spiroforme]|nr:hypothetical protein [Thomasclavelia spiroformis]